MKKPKFHFCFTTGLGLLLLAAQPMVRAADADPAVPDPATNTVSAAPVEMEDAQAGTNATASADAEGGRSKRSAVHREAIVVFGRDVELKAGEEAEAVVVIGGSAKIRGKVNEAVVTIGGDADVSGEVGGSVVSVLGNAKIAKEATIQENLVVVGGKAEIAEGASIKGETQEVDFGWLRSWFLQCFLKFRPLAPQVGWVWVVAGAFFVFYSLVALVFPRPVQACVEEMARRPITTILLGLLAELLVPVIVVLLVATGVGAIVVPFALAAVVLAAIVGKVGFLEWIGLRVGSGVGAEVLQRPFAAFLVGVILITLLYMVPFLGLFTFALVGTWGLGGAVGAAFGGFKRELPEKPAPQPPAPSAARPEAPDLATGVTLGLAGEANPGAQVASQPGPAPVPVPELLSQRRAGFWERMGAAFLDLVLVGVLAAIVQVPPLGFLVALAYFAGMWGWKGTTIGGIVLGLKVVRVDGQPVSFLVAIVRGLAAAFSVVVLFLGFLWIAWDPEKQGWHDRIAGTVVLKMPRGMPLI